MAGSGPDQAPRRHVSQEGLSTGVDHVLGHEWLNTGAGAHRRRDTSPVRQPLTKTSLGRRAAYSCSTSRPDRASECGNGIQWPKERSPMRLVTPESKRAAASGIPGQKSPRSSPPSTASVTPVM